MSIGKFVWQSQYIIVQLHNQSWSSQFPPSTTVSGHFSLPAPVMCYQFLWSVPYFSQLCITKYPERQISSPLVLSGYHDRYTETTAGV